MTYKKGDVVLVRMTVDKDYKEYEGVVHAHRSGWPPNYDTVNPDTVVEVVGREPKVGEIYIDRVTHPAKKNSYVVRIVSEKTDQVCVELIETNATTFVVGGFLLFVKDAFIEFEYVGTEEETEEV